MKLRNKKTGEIKSIEEIIREAFLRRGGRVSLFKKKKSLKIGRRVAVIAYSRSSGRDEFKIGKIVAIRPQEKYDSFDCNYAVRFDDGKIDLFTATRLFTEWGEEE